MSGVESVRQLAERIEKALMMPWADDTSGKAAAAPSCSYADAQNARAALTSLVGLAERAHQLEESLWIAEQNRAEGWTLFRAAEARVVEYREALEKIAEPLDVTLYEGTTRNPHSEAQALARYVLDGGDISTHPVLGAARDVLGSEGESS